MMDDLVTQLSNRSSFLGAMQTRVTLPQLPTMPMKVSSRKTERGTTSAAQSTSESTGRRRERPRIEQLPTELQGYFHRSGQIILFAKRVAGTLRPFVNPTVEIVQDILDFFFPDKYEVTSRGDIIYQLVSTYCISRS